LTLQKSSPYPLEGSNEKGRLIRTLLLIACTGAVLGCAQDAAHKGEISQLRAEVRALRELNGRVERRLERLEANDAVESSSRGRSSGPSSEAQRDSSVPELTVVKLKPRAVRMSPVLSESRARS
jgi:hypothetical protein